MSLFIRLIAGLGLICLSLPAQAAPALWEVRDGDSAVWLFGSIHVLPADLEWRTPLFESTLNQADTVIFETDVTPEAMAQIGAQAFVQGVYVDGTVLTDVIDDETERKLRRVVASCSLQMGAILAMRPWLAANTISGAVLASLGYDAQGVEFVLQPELDAERVGYLETGEQQLAVLAGASEDEQIAMLQSTLDEIATMPKLMSKMMRGWVGGAPEVVNMIASVEMGGMETVFLDRLLYARNRNWLEPIEAMLADDKQNLIVVGAAHLAGDSSVLDLLAQAGYSVERIQ